MTPEAAIASLRRQLEQHGQIVELRRLTGTQAISFAVRVRAFVADYAPQELVGEINADDSSVIVSPVEIEASGWPGPEVPAGSTQQDLRVPRRGDAVVIAGKVRTVEEAKPKYLDDVLVRIDMRVLG
jgi:hypothetical protein